MLKKCPICKKQTVLSNGYCLNCARDVSEALEWAEDEDIRFEGDDHDDENYVGDDGDGPY